MRNKFDLHELELVTKTSIKITFNLVVLYIDTALTPNYSAATMA
jgi:hypothetical protein